VNAAKKTAAEKPAKKTTRADSAKAEKKVEKATKKEIRKTVKKTVKKLLKAQEKNEKLLKKTAKHTENAAAKKMVELIEKTLSAGKAEDIVILDLSGKTALADYLVVATGRAPRHVTALAEQVQLRLKKTGVPATLEGGDVGDWVIVDAGDVIVHVFHPETRELYCIEELWGEETPRKAK
jgi:ribosome-associated protein